MRTMPLQVRTTTVALNAPPETYSSQQVIGFAGADPAGWQVQETVMIPHAGHCAPPPEVTNEKKTDTKRIENMV